MHLSKKNIISSVTAIFGCLWLWQNPGYEPLIVTITAIIALIAIALTKSIPIQNINIHTSKLTENQYLIKREALEGASLNEIEASILGESIKYLDNNQKSEVLVIFLHGLGLDSNDFCHYMDSSNYRCIAPTLYGFNKDENIVVPLGIDIHTKIICDFIKNNVKNIEPKKVLVVGFSIGADMMQYAIKSDKVLSKLVDFILLLDGNICLNTCTISKRFASIKDKNNGNVMDVLNSFSEGIDDIVEWLQVHQYLLKVFSKFDNRTNLLAAFAQETVDRFKSSSMNGLADFVSNLQIISDETRAFQYIFSGDKNNVMALRDLKLLMHNNYLKPSESYSDSMISLKSDMKHFDLLERINLSNFIEESVSKIK